MGEDLKVLGWQHAHPNFSNQFSLWPLEKASAESPDNFSEVYLDTALATTYTRTSYLQEDYTVVTVKEMSCWRCSGGEYQHVRAVQERNMVSNENPAMTQTSNNTSLTDKLGPAPAPCP